MDENEYMVKLFIKSSPFWSINHDSEAQYSLSGHNLVLYNINYTVSM